MSYGDLEHPVGVTEKNQGLSGKTLRWGTGTPQDGRRTDTGHTRLKYTEKVTFVWNIGSEPLPPLNVTLEALKVWGSRKLKLQVVTSIELKLSLKPDRRQIICEKNLL